MLKNFILIGLLILLLTACQQNKNRVILKGQAFEVELADDFNSRAMGLMYRESMPDTHGMLFLFPDETMRAFWMKNTYLSLDILYLNKDKEIIRISKETTPLSERSIPSGGKAMYVLEVLAGFTDAYQIHTGDHIEFTIK